MTAAAAIQRGRLRLLIFLTAGFSLGPLVFGLIGSRAPCVTRSSASSGLIADLDPDVPVTSLTN